jgi:hypothetical protein
MSARTLASEISTCGLRNSHRCLTCNGYGPGQHISHFLPIMELRRVMTGRFGSRTGYSSAHGMVVCIDRSVCTLRSRCILETRWRWAPGHAKGSRLAIDELLFIEYAALTAYAYYIHPPISIGDVLLRVHVLQVRLIHSSSFARDIKRGGRSIQGSAYLCNHVGCQVHDGISRLGVDGYQPRLLYA